VSGDGAAGSASADSLPGGFAIRTVAVIGAGAAGRGFALACAAAGFNVVVEDVMPANLRQAQEEYADLELLNADAQGSRGRLEVALTVEDAVRTADIVVDFVPDELESKLEIFCLIDRMAPPKTALLTPSEALSITDLASCTYRADRCFAVRGGLANAASGRAIRLLHPERADAAVLGEVRAFLRAVGCKPQVELDADAPMLVKNVR
jgi:3-hydroxybutyryl-CoA dehydrogenase